MRTHEAEAVQVQVQVSVPRSKWQEQEGGGPRRWVPDGDVLVTLDLDVDMKALAVYMGGRVLSSKSGRSVMQDGIVVAKLVRQERRPAGAS